MVGPGKSDDLATMEMLNGWPASFNVSFPLTGCEAKVPDALKVTVVPLSGVAAAAENVRAAAVTVKINTLLDEIIILLRWSIAAV